MGRRFSDGATGGVATGPCRAPAKSGGKAAKKGKRLKADDKKSRQGGGKKPTTQSGVKSAPAKKLNATLSPHSNIFTMEAMANFSVKDHFLDMLRSSVHNIRIKGDTMLHSCVEFFSNRARDLWRTSSFNGTNVKQRLVDLNADRPTSLGRLLSREPATGLPRSPPKTPPGDWNAPLKYLLDRSFTAQRHHSSCPDFGRADALAYRALRDAFAGWIVDAPKRDDEQPDFFYIFRRRPERPVFLHELPDDPVEQKKEETELEFLGAALRQLRDQKTDPADKKPKPPDEILKIADPVPAATDAVPMAVEAVAKTAEAVAKTADSSPTRKKRSKPIKKSSKLSKKLNRHNRSSNVNLGSVLRKFPFVNDLYDFDKYR